MSNANSKWKALTLSCTCIIVIISCVRSLQICLNDSEKIWSPWIRQITNDCISLKIFVFSHYGLKYGHWKSDAFLKWFSVFNIQQSLFCITSDSQQGEVGLFFGFRHSHWDQIPYFDIRNPILTFTPIRKILFWHLKSYLTFALRWKILFRYSKSYFDIRTELKNPILTFKILFWHSHWVRISYFDIQNPILTFALSRKILFWHSKSYFDIRTESENPILTVKILF